MRRALVVTVGTGTREGVDITRPLVKMIGDANPQFVCFLVTADSEQNARRVAERLQMTDDAFRLHTIAGVDDVEATFKDASQVIRMLLARGYRAEEIGVDFTSGTKAMTAGLVLAAVASGCGSLKYITGQRERGIVVDGTERFLSIPPDGILAYRDLELARKLLLHLQFRGALERCQAINPVLLDAGSRELHEELMCLARAYDSWDKFDHRRFAGEYGKVDPARPEHAPFRVAPGIPGRLIALGKAIDEKKVTEDLLADLFNNAERRIGEGKYDDAVARLYRLVEMLAQRELRVFGIDTSDVDLPRVPADQREALAQRRDPRDGQVKLGIRDAYRLLEALGSPLGARLESTPGLKDGLATRNRSILAHGTQPIGERVARSLLEAVLLLVSSTVAEFDARCRELQFPWLSG